MVVCHILTLIIIIGWGSRNVHSAINLQILRLVDRLGSWDARVKSQNTFLLKKSRNPTECFLTEDRFVTWHFLRAESGHSFNRIGPKNHWSVLRLLFLNWWFRAGLRRALCRVESPSWISFLPVAPINNYLFTDPNGFLSVRFFYELHKLYKDG